MYRSAMDRQSISLKISFVAAPLEATRWSRWAPASTEKRRRLRKIRVAADSTDEMQHSHLLPSSSGSALPERFLSGLAGFAELFTRRTWTNVLVLLAGVILAPGRRTVPSALRILGRECDPDF